MKWLCLGITLATASLELAVQPILDEMAQKYNMSFSFGFTNASGRLALASGLDSIWSRRGLQPEDLIPLGSVTKSWTAVMVLQAVERGRVSLDDCAFVYIDPVMQRLWRSSMRKLWGAEVEKVKVRDLLGMTSCIADYDDFFMEHFTFAFAGDDAGPFLFLKSASKQGLVCRPGSLEASSVAVYSGTNYVLLGLLLVEIRGMWAWQDLDQISVIPGELYRSKRYAHTSFSRLGRCTQYPGIAHQYAWTTWASTNSTEVFEDLLNKSCLNGWTMGNIATTPKDLSSFFFDLFNLPGRAGGFLKKPSLDSMMQFKRLNDTWCEGPNGPGSCRYGMGMLVDQLGQDYWPLLNSSEDRKAVEVLGHPGEDWGSGCSPCGYNAKYHFGICMAYTSVMGMNCSGDFRYNLVAVQEATCLVYDKVLSIFGGPRLNCSMPSLPGPPLKVDCKWVKQTKKESRAWFRAKDRQKYGKLLSEAQSILV